MNVYNNMDGSTGCMHSSKGNQLKFNVDNKWYKADYFGYEGAAEYICSEILVYSNISSYVSYELNEINYNSKIFNGCVSDNFLSSGYNLITTERLFESNTGKKLEELLAGKEPEEMIEYYVDAVKEMTGLSYFGEYLTYLLELDELVLNEDRHFHNIAVIEKDSEYYYCPIFDNGAAFLSDTRLDYPLESNIYGLIPTVQAKPFSKSFETQAQICRNKYGPQLNIYKHINLDSAYKNINAVYGNKVTERIKDIYEHQAYLCMDIFRDRLQSPVWENDSRNYGILRHNGIKR